MDVIVNIATGFMSWFKAGGQTLWGWVVGSVAIDEATGAPTLSIGMIPQILCLLTFMNSIILLIGEDKVNNFAQKLTKNMILRYTLFPLIALIFLCNPMMYTFGRFVEEKYKPSFYDATVSMCHPVTGLFPHANAGELFVFNGIAAGITSLGLNQMDLAVRYFICGIIVILLRGILCQMIYFRIDPRYTSTGKLKAAQQA